MWLMWLLLGARPLTVTVTVNDPVLLTTCTVPSTPLPPSACMGPVKGFGVGGGVGVAALPPEEDPPHAASASVARTPDANRLICSTPKPKWVTCVYRTGLHTSRALRRPLLRSVRARSRPTWGRWRRDPSS